MSRVSTASNGHTSLWGTRDHDGWLLPTCQCGWTFGPVPDDETCCDVLMAHAYQRGIVDEAQRVE